MNAIANQNTYIKFTVAITLLCVIAGLLFPLSVLAETDSYSDALSDLKRDPAFSPTEYTVLPTDYSLKVIQIAESIDNELYIYVYQPSKTDNIKASSINISTKIDDELSFKNYQLVYLNSNGVFFKYKVKDLTVSTDSIRHYVISSIYRPWDINIDTSLSNDNQITEVSYSVNRQYSFVTYDNNVTCSAVDIETILITSKFVGYVRYFDGMNLFAMSCDSHFVAFDTDKPIDRLLEADVYFTSQDYEFYSGYDLDGDLRFDEDTYIFSNKKDNYAYLKYTDKVDHNGGNLFSRTYTWDRIQSVADFINTEKRENIYRCGVIDVSYGSQLTDYALRELSNKQWVLRFTETDMKETANATTGSYYSKGTLVGDVTILRLKFETDGKVYNLGVIDNKQNGAREPSNNSSLKVQLNENGKKLIGWIVVIIIVIILLPIIVEIIKSIIKTPAKIIKANRNKRKRR